MAAAARRGERGSRSLDLPPHARIPRKVSNMGGTAGGARWRGGANKPSRKHPGAPHLVVDDKTSTPGVISSGWSALVGVLDRLDAPQLSCRSLRGAGLERSSSGEQDASREGRRAANCCSRGAHRVEATHGRNDASMRRACGGRRWLMLQGSRMEARGAERGADAAAGGWSNSSIAGAGCERAACESGLRGGRTERRRQGRSSSASSELTSWGLFYA